MKKPVGLEKLAGGFEVIMKKKQDIPASMLFIVVVSLISLPQTEK
jgi:hypothetical protein